MLNRRLLRLALPLTVGALALSACGGDDDGGGGGDGKKTYTIAYQGPLSGDNAQLGINMDNGVRLAIDEANKSGDLPFTLKFANSDDVGDPAQAPSAAQKLIDDESVMGVVGPAFSGATKASEQLFSEANLASVTPSATNPQLSELGFTTFFRAVSPDTVQGAQAAEYMAKTLKAKKVFVVDDKGEYGVGLADEIEKGLKEQGVASEREGVAAGTKDYTAVATKAVKSGADALYYAGYYADAALLAKSLDSAGFKGPKLSDDGTNDDEFIKGAGAASEGWFLTCPCSDPRTDPKAKSFTDAYKAAYNADPGTYSPEAYDAANVIIEVMKGIEGDITREAVVEGLRTVDYQGITKKLKFQENGEVESGKIYVYEVKNGERVMKGAVDELVGG